MIFKAMKLEEAKKLYNNLKKQKCTTLTHIAMEDLYFFTDGLTQDYGC